LTSPISWKSSDDSQEMALRLTIDASVFVSALSPLEKRQGDSVRFLDDLEAKAALVVLPALVRAELAGAISRTSRDADAGRKAARLGFLPVPLVLVELDERLCEDAAEIAAAGPMKGADAMYVAVARRYEAVLVSLDRDHLQKSPPGVVVCDPVEALSL
jgi:predicted nucleic acid-binding protein